METYFCSDEFELAYPDGVEHHWWHLARNRIIVNAVQSLAGSEAVVLDVGCGRGITVKYLREQGLDCFGVELGSSLPMTGVEPYIRVGMRAETLPRNERQRYDTILLLDVIEHLLDPDTFLQNLVSAFPKLSYLVLTVPARQELWSNYDEFYGHHRRYALDDIEGFSRRLRWDLPFQSYFFHVLYPPAWGLARLKLKRETKFIAPQGIGRWVHKLFSYGMVLDHNVFPRKLVGTSLLACFHLQREPGSRGGAGSQGAGEPGS